MTKRHSTTFTDQFRKIHVSHREFLLNLQTGTSPLQGITQHDEPAVPTNQYSTPNKPSIHELPKVSTTNL